MIRKESNLKIFIKYIKIFFVFYLILLICILMLVVLKFYLYFFSNLGFFFVFVIDMKLFFSWFFGLL